jgi:tetratricopeptide (TPR) repeat protein
MKQKFLNILMLGLLLSVQIDAQELKVKYMKQAMSDLSASINQRNDETGIPCGLVKVQIGNPEISFGGDVVGQTTNNMNEYWVYLRKGTRCFTVNRKHFLPQVIQFSEYGIDEIESKVTYLLQLRETTFNLEKSTLLLNIHPQNAKLRIDNIEIENNEGGSFRMYLSKGEHVCRIDAVGYKSAVEIVNTGKELNSKDISLESLMAKVKIKCKTNDVALFLNGEKIAKDYWEGDLVSGRYVIEAQKDGFLTEKLEVFVAEKEMSLFELPKLSQLKGDIRVVSNISDFNKVSVDGKEMFINEDKLHDIRSGKHIVTFCKYGYGCVEVPIYVRGNGNDSIRYHFVPLKEYEKAVRNDGAAQYEAARRCDGLKDYKQALYWYSLSVDNLIDDGNVDLKSTAMLELARLYGNKKEKTEVYNLQKAVDSYLKFIEYTKKRNEPFLSNDRIYNSYCSIGDLYYDEGNYKEAINWYKKGVNYDEDNNFRACLYIGECYEKVGEDDSAIVWYKKTLSSRFDHYRNKAQLQLEKLKSK